MYCPGDTDIMGNIFIIEQENPEMDLILGRYGISAFLVLSPFLETAQATL